MHGPQALQTCELQPRVTPFRTLVRHNGMRNTRGTDGGHINYYNDDNGSTLRAAAGCSYTPPVQGQRQRIVKTDGKARLNGQPRRHLRLWSSQWEPVHWDAQKRLLSPPSSTSTSTAWRFGVVATQQSASIETRLSTATPIGSCEKNVEFETSVSICEVLEDI